MNQTTNTGNSSILKIKNVPRVMIAKAVIERVSMFGRRSRDVDYDYPDPELLEVVSLFIILKALYPEGIIEDYLSQLGDISAAYKWDIYETGHIIDELVSRNFIVRTGDDIYLPEFEDTAPEKCIDISYHPDNGSKLSEVLTSMLYEVLNPETLEALKTRLVD
jgi:hypothetical protein